MSGLQHLGSTLLALFLTISFLVFLIGTCSRIWLYSRTPIDRPIPLTPAPRTRFGLVMRFLAELVFFRSLFKANKWTWLFAWTFHTAFVFLLLAHLRFFMQPAWNWVYYLQLGTGVASVLLIFGLSGLLARRFVIERIRYISVPSDYLWLVLLLVLASTGWLMNTLGSVNLYQAGLFARGLVVFNWQQLPGSILFVMHLVCVFLLLLLFPISKLLHAPGIFFSPTITRRDRSRARVVKAGQSADQKPDGNTKR